MINLNEIFQEEGFEVLNFNDYCLLEKHGVLSGDKSCSKFASRLMDFMEHIFDSEGIDEMHLIIHTNENFPGHEKYIEMGVQDYSKEDIDWFLPDWADWELIIHIGEIKDDSYEQAAMYAGELEAHLFLKSGRYIKNHSRVLYSSDIQHEMKHYFDAKIKFVKYGKNNTKKLSQLLTQFKENVDNLDKYKASIAKFFNYFLYATSEGEMSAWLEQSRAFGIEVKDRHSLFPYLFPYKNRAVRYPEYKKVIETILLWKDDESQYDKVCKRMFCFYGLGDLKTYDKFKKFIMDTYGDYMELRFGQKASFEKYMKGYLKILKKQINKHNKIWADGFMGVNLDESPEEIKDILIKKREERLERIRKKKEDKEGKKEDKEDKKEDKK